jgi:hypothetical protein
MLAVSETFSWSVRGQVGREHLARVAASLYARPRKALGWQTPADLLHRQLACWDVSKTGLAPRFWTVVKRVSYAASWASR